MEEQSAESPKEAFTWTATQPDSAAGVCCWGALRRLVALQRKLPALFFIGKGGGGVGFGCYQVGADQYQTPCLPRKQAAGSAPSCSQCALRPGGAQPSCDTDPTPIAAWQPALIDPSNALTSIYILFVTRRACCAHTRLCTASLDAVVLCVCVCVYVWLGHLYCFAVDMDPL